MKYMNSRYRALQSGFTLLEMVLVLLIMGMVASLSVVFIDNEENQLRYEETIQKLETMHKATVIVKDYKEDFLLSGFVVDNGVLPSDANEFVGIPVGWIEYGETYQDLTDPLNSVTKSRVPPYFRLTERDLTDNTLWPDGGYSRLPDSPNTPLHLRKGYLANYISLGVDSQGNYKDAWGDEFPIIENVLDLAIDTSVKTIELADFIGDVNDDGISDMNKNVPINNWSIALTDISFEVTNNSQNEVSNAIMGITVFNNKNFTRPSFFIDSESEHCKECWETSHFKKACNLNNKEVLATIAVCDLNGGLICTPEAVNNTKQIFPENSTKPIIWQTIALGGTENDELNCTENHVNNINNRVANDVRIPAGEHIVFVGVDDDGNGKIEGNDLNGDGKIERLDLNDDGDYVDLNVGGEIGNNEFDEFDEFKAIGTLRVIPRYKPGHTATLVIE